MLSDGGRGRHRTNIEISEETRAAFRDWLRGELRRLEFYSWCGDHYLIREFAKYCCERGTELKKDLTIDEASLGRYLRDDNPVVPTPDRCRMLAAVLGVPSIGVLIRAGHVTEEDLEGLR